MIPYIGSVRPSDGLPGGDVCNIRAGYDGTLVISVTPEECGWAERVSSGFAAPAHSGAPGRSGRTACPEADPAGR